jgi:hypothetical protein
LLGVPFANPDFLWLSSAMILFLFIGGILYFRRVENLIADFI